MVTIVVAIDRMVALDHMVVRDHMVTIDHITITPIRIKEVGRGTRILAKILIQIMGIMHGHRHHIEDPNSSHDRYPSTSDDYSHRFDR